MIFMACFCCCLRVRFRGDERLWCKAQGYRDQNSGLCHVRAFLRRYFRMNEKFDSTAVLWVVE
jgi:hypothetical protein